MITELLAQRPLSPAPRPPGRVPAHAPAPTPSHPLSPSPSPSPTTTQIGGDDTALSITMHVVHIALSAVAIVIFLVTLSILLRYFWRYVYHRIRLAYLGGMKWTEITYDGAIGDSEINGAVAQMHNMANIVRSSMGGAFHFYFGRPMTMLVIKSDPEDGVHLYVGMDKKHYDPNLVQGWATDANCGVQELDDGEGPDIDARAPIVGTVEGFDPQTITDSPQNSTIGQVVSKMQGASRSISGAVVIAYEPMRQSEESKTRRHIETETQILEGLDSPWDGSARNLGIMTSLSPSRGTMTAFSSDGRTNSSTQLLHMARASMPAMGVRVRPATLAQMHRIYGFFAVIASVPLLLASWFYLLPWWLSIPTLVLGLIASLGLPILSSSWISMSARKDGTVPIPPFWSLSLRRLVHEQIKRNWFGNRNKSGIDSYCGPPSCKEVLPFYQTSLMQFASMPTSGSGVTNVSSSAVPQIGMPKSVDSEISDIVDSGDVVYLGMSAKTGAPVYRTLSDINFGIAIGGDAGSGKTNALTVDFIGMCRLSRKNTGLSADATITPIWFETKSDNLSALYDLAKPYKPLFVKLHDPASKARLSLEGPRYGDDGVTIKDVLGHNNALISAMKAIWGDSFGPQSAQVASSSLGVASLLDADGVRQVICGRGAEDMNPDRVEMMVTRRIANPSRPNIIRLMQILIGGDNSLDMVKNLEGYREDINTILMDRSKEMEIKASKGAGEIDRLRTLETALSALINLHKKSEAVAPLQNKLPQLLASNGVWETVTEEGESRKEYSLDVFLDYGGPVILDLTSSGSIITRDNAELFCMMLHYMLWQRIQSIGGGWGEKKRYTPLYADEIVNFTGRGETDSTCGSIISEVREQGRSYGVSHNVGFQNFTQMPKDVARNVASFESKIYLKFTDPVDLKTVVSYLSEKTRYSSENFRRFPQGFGVAMMTIGRVPRSEFTIKTPYSKTWAKALESGETIQEAFDSIHDSELGDMKKQSKSKIAKQSPSRSTIDNSPLVDDGTFDGGIDRGYQQNDGDEPDDPGPTLTWS